MNAIQVTFRDLPYSPAIEFHIKEKAAKLREYFERFIYCHVVLTIPQKHKHQGKLFNVRINLAVPGKEIAVTHQLNQDIYVAIRDAFDALGRRIENYLDRRHGDVKAHRFPLRGYVLRIFPDEGFGFIKGQDDNEYYFSLTNVSAKKFHHLRIGDSVHFLTEPSDEGLQARRVVKARYHYAKDPDRE